MVIYTTEATSVADVQNAVESNFEGGCQATSDSGQNFQTDTCTGKLKTTYEIRGKVMFSLVCVILYKRDGVGDQYTLDHKLLTPQTG